MALQDFIDDGDDIDELLSRVTIRTIGSIHGSLVKVSPDNLAQLIEKKMYQRVAQAVYKVAQEARDRAKVLCPKKTGALAASIYVTNPGARPENFKQRTQGYWRSISAAARRNTRLEIAGMGMVYSVRTQSRRDAHKVTAMTGPGKGLVATDLVGKDADEIGDINLPNAFSFMPMATVGADQFYITIGVAAYYAGYIEFPRQGYPGHPFFTPAIEWARAQAPQVIMREVNGLN